MSQAGTLEWQAKPRRALSRCSVTGADRVVFVDHTSVTAADDVVSDTASRTSTVLRSKTSPFNADENGELLVVGPNPHDFRPRRMWGWQPGQAGYCGETCFQEALLYYGSYVSAERIRYAAGNNEVLVGVHERQVAKALKLHIDVFDTDLTPEPQAETFVWWSANHVRHARPVVAGFYVFKADGDQEYDHIMPMSGVVLRDLPIAKGKGSEPSGLPGRIPSRSVAALCIHDLASSGSRQLWRLPTADGILVASRAGCADERLHPDTSRARECRLSYALPEEQCFGFAVLGNVDQRGRASAKRLVLLVDQPEEPDWGAENGVGAETVLLPVSAKCLDLTPGRRVLILRFDDAKLVPTATKQPRACKWSRAWVFEATAPSVLLERFDTVPSDGAVFYRAYDCSEADLATLSDVAREGL